MKDPKPLGAAPEAFVARLEALDSASRARLKRNAGKSIAESRDVLGLFYSLLPSGVPRWQVERYFTVATLYPLVDGGAEGDFGRMLRRARNDANQQGLDRRMERLLDADRTQLPFRLRQALLYIHSQRGRVDWQQLLKDVLDWNRPSRIVQRRWAHSYYGAEAAFAEKSDATAETNN